MSKRLVDIDDQLLERARAAAGTDTIKATVAAGLRKLAEQELVLRHLRRLGREDALDSDRLKQAREPRIRSHG